MRRESREIALKVLFQLEFKSPLTKLDLMNMLETKVEKDVFVYAEKIINGVKDNIDQIDEQIKAKSRHWKIERMSIVDRNILRMSLFEMKYSNEPIKPNIVINEAVEIAQKFGNTDSGAFVNGILDALAKNT